MRQEIHSLTSIRGLAAAWVFLVHYQAEYKQLFPSLIKLNPWVFLGPDAVTLFFILSGYVIGMNYFERMRDPNRTQIFRFISLRFARIYPVHFFTLIGMLAAVWKGGWPKASHFSVWHFVENLLLIQAWGPNPTLSWNYPSWSISSEWFVYCICPLIFWGLHKLRNPILKWILLGVCVVGTAAVKYPGISFFNSLSRAVLPFTGGILLTVFFPPASCENPKASLVWGAVGSIFLIPALIDDQAFQSALLVVPFFLLIGTLGCGRFKALPVFLHPLTIYLGDISYSLYLTQVPTLTALSAIIGSQRWNEIQQWGCFGRLVVLLSYPMVVILVAALTHAVIEKPARDLLRKWIPKVMPG